MDEGKEGEEGAGVGTDKGKGEDKDTDKGGVRAQRVQMRARGCESTAGNEGNEDVEDMDEGNDTRIVIVTIIASRVR